MAEALADMTEHTLASPEGRAADQYFHAALLEASGNPFLVTLTSGVGAAVAWTTIFKQRHMPLSRDPIPDHRRVFEAVAARSEEHTSELQSLMRTSYAVFCSPTKNNTT